MQTESRPDTAPPRPGTSGVHKAVKTPPPVLASEALREDLAPIEPGRRASRIWDLGLAGAFVVLGIGFKAGLGIRGASPDAASVCFAAGLATAATAALPFSYLWRAVVGGVVSLAVVLIGLRGGGPLSLLIGRSSSATVEVGRIMAATLLPAALLFRAHYRAYRRGKALLAGATLVSLPLAAHAAVVLGTGHGMAALVGATLVLCAIASAALGFTAAATTTVTAWWAEIVTATLAVDVALRQLGEASPAGAGPLAHVLTALALVISASPIALGLFQVLAAVYGPDARRVDVRTAQE